MRSNPHLIGIYAAVTVILYLVLHVLENLAPAIHAAAV